MRRITLALVSTVAALVLLFSYRTSLGGSLPGSAAAAAAPGVVPDAPGAATAKSGSSHAGSSHAGSSHAGSSHAGSSHAGSSKSGPAKAVLATGQVAQTRWGPVQVRVRIVGTKITDVTVLQRPSGNSQDEEINGYALPQLRVEVLQVQSAQIDTVSGATVTSDGYLTSLQSALDAAHFG